MAAIAVSVARGSMTTISGLCGLRQTRSHKMGWAMHMLEPTRTMTSDASRSA